MKNILRLSAVACAALCLSIGFKVSPAFAQDSDATIRAAQMRLADLGYYVGRYDGVMGPVTEAAIMDFQRDNGLVMSGRLSPQTYTLIARADNMAYHSGYYYRYATPVRWYDSWHTARTETIAMRYARLDVNEETSGSLRHYSVTLNGRPVLFADNQPSILRVSRVYTLDGEDAVIFTAYQGDSSCAYRNYLLTVRSNATFTGPREIGNCAGAFEAHVAGNALFVTFPDGLVMDGLRSWGTWRYENNTLVRI